MVTAKKHKSKWDNLSVDISIKCGAERATGQGGDAPHWTPQWQQVLWTPGASQGEQLFPAVPGPASPASATKSSCCLLCLASDAGTQHHMLTHCNHTYTSQWTKLHCNITQRRPTPDQNYQHRLFWAQSVLLLLVLISVQSTSRYKQVTRSMSIYRKANAELKTDDSPQL